MEIIMTDKENLKELLDKAYKMRDELKNDYRFAVVMECLAVISQITAIIK